MNARHTTLADASQIPTIRWAQGQHEIKNPVDKNVLIAVATSLDVDGDDCPSPKALAEHTAFHDRTVRRALDRLEAQGYLRREMRNTSKGDCLSNRLFLLIDRPTRTEVGR